MANEAKNVATEAKVKYRITRLSAAEIDCPWFCAVPKDYKNKLTLMQMKMAGRYKEMEELISKLLNSTKEDLKIGRFLPKKEWVLGYGVQVASGTTIQHYLLLVGAEVLTQSKSMSYGQGFDNYSYKNCYFVLGSKDVLSEEKYGTASGSRKVRDQAFHEYGVTTPGVHELVLRLLKWVLPWEQANAGAKPPASA